MSTRSGNVLYLDDVVTAAQDAMYQKMLEDAKGNSLYTLAHTVGKLEEITVERGEDPRAVADLIGLSACVAADFGAKRIKDYVVRILFCTSFSRP
jgi:arginyl-tRNA synthetase